MEAEQLTNGIDDNDTTEEVEIVMMLPTKSIMREMSKVGKQTNYKGR